MSTFVYLTEDMVEHSSVYGNGIFAFHGGKIKVMRDDDGRLTFQVKNESSPPQSRIPEILRPFVESISMRRDFLNNPRRITGVYRHNTAEATLEFHAKDPDWVTIAVQGPDIFDVDELYRKVRAGSLAPDENWEAEQADTSPRLVVATVVQQLPPHIPDDEPAPDSSKRGQVICLSDHSSSPQDPEKPAS